MGYALLRLVLDTLLITPSGALSPGPLTMSAIAIGSRRGWFGGVLVSFGHMIVELPYVIALTAIFSSVKPILAGPVGDLLTVFSAAFILYFAYLMLKDVIRGDSGGSGSLLVGRYGAVATGAVLTGFNVYFLIWWVSVGFPLIKAVSELGVVGFAIMYVSHVWMDYVWLTLMAGLGSEGRKLLGGRGYRAMLAAIAIILVIFAADLLMRRFLGTGILPL